MTERREPPRIGTSDGRPRIVEEEGASRSAPRRLGRLVASPAARRLVLSRVGRAATFGLVAAVLTIAGGASLWRWAVDWLHRRPEYQVAFKDIRLVPDPPPWIKGGREALLRDVLAGRKSLETFSILDARLDEILDEFRRNPWVVRADRIARAHPNTIEVSLEYREPAAIIHLGKTTYALDSDSIVLPPDGIDLSGVSLLEIRAAPPPATDLKPGLPYPEEKTTTGNDPILVASRLAGFLKDRARQEPDLAGRLQLGKVLFVKRDKDGRKFLWVAGPRKNFLLWGDIDKLGSVAEISDDEKWAMLKSWVEGDKAWKGDPIPDYFEFSRVGIRPSSS